MKNTIAITFISTMLLTACVELQEAPVINNTPTPREIARAEALNKKHVIFIDNLQISMDSAGGVDVHIEYENLSKKVIKYAYFFVKPYNPVDDVMTCSIRGYSLTYIYDTGPVDFEVTHYPGWGTVWYNYDISRVELVGIRIHYMNGTVANLLPKDYIILKKSSY